MEQLEKKVSYSVGTKVNIGNFQSVDIHLSESDTFDVAGLDLEEIDQLAKERYDALRAKLDAQLMSAVAEVKGT